MKLFFVLTAGFLILLSLASQAQTASDSTLVRIETNDGNEFVGKLVTEDSLKIVLKTENFGEILIQKRNIKRQEFVAVQQIKNGELWFANPQSTRCFWSPNGYGLKQGEGYYQNIWVLWNQFAYGVTDNFSIGAGVVPLFLFGGSPTPIFLTSKISIPVKEEKINLSAGIIAGTILGNSEDVFGIAYGVSTFGTPDNNVSFGLGYGLAGGEWASSPLINVSGMFRLSAKWYFLTENYYVNDDDGGIAAISGGARWIIKKAALDFGLFIPVAKDAGFIGLPWLGVTIPLGKAK